MADRNEFQILSGLAPEDLTRQLGELSGQGWDVVSFSDTGTTAYTALLSRKAPKGRRLDGGEDGPADTDG
jgi:hypothetical protein